MSYSLVIGGRASYARIFHDLHGRSTLARFPGRVLLFLGEPSDYDLGSNVTIEIVEYMDPVAMLELARRYQASDGIDSVSTLDERTIDVVARLREGLGMPGIQPAQARLFRDKVVMKERLNEVGLRVPAWCPAADRKQSADLLARCGKAVLKPRDGLGSRQVSFIHSQDELDAVMQTRRNWSNFELEEFIDGVLYHTNSVVIDGEVRFTAIGQYLPGMGNIDYTHGAPFVSLMEVGGALYQRLLDFSIAAIAALGLKDGVTHMELFHASNDEIVFCETAIRPGGGGITHMIEAQYGINMSLAALLIDAGRGELALQDLGEGRQQMGLIGLRNTSMGTVSLAPGGRRIEHPWLKLLEVEVRDGEFRAPSSHCTDFTALAILAADGIEQFRQRIAQVSDHFEQHLQLV